VEKKYGRGEKSGHLGLLIAGPIFSAVAVPAVFAQLESQYGNAPTTKHYLPEYSASGNLILSKNFNAWVFVVSSLTPKALERHAWLSR
jgi:hypothetical protein